MGNNSKLTLWLTRLLVLALCLVALEVASQLAFRVYKGAWYNAERKRNPPGICELHPYLGACFQTNISKEVNGVHISINSFRCRGAEFSRPKPAGLQRIVALGGSSTFCVGVSDDQTWEHFLREQLGTNHEVINMGAPGGTSIETMIQSALLFSDIQPDVALYYLGWNDSQVQHIKGLAPDWSDYHGKMITSQGLSGDQLRERTATGYLLKRVVFHYFFPGMDPPKFTAALHGTTDALTDLIDQRALGHYERNLRNIAAICRAQGIRPVFIPQILNYDVLTSDKPYGFLPFIRDRDLKTVMKAYNETLARVARETGAGFVGGVLEQSYSAADFIDMGHFSAQGNKRFAAAVAQYLAESGGP